MAIESSVSRRLFVVAYCVGRTGRCRSCAQAWEDAFCDLSAAPPAQAGRRSVSHPGRASRRDRDPGRRPAGRSAGSRPRVRRSTFVSSGSGGPDVDPRSGSAFDMDCGGWPGGGPSRAVGSHCRYAFPEPYVNLSAHTAFCIRPWYCQCTNNDWIQPCGSLRGPAPMATMMCQLPCQRTRRK